MSENIYAELQQKKVTIEGRGILGVSPIDEVDEENETSGHIENESYDRLDFTRPVQDLAPHYTSTEEMRSSKSNSPARSSNPSPASQINPCIVVKPTAGDMSLNLYGILNESSTPANALSAIGSPVPLESQLEEEDCGQLSDRSDFTRDVLQCVDNLQSMSRKTVYQPETEEICDT